MNNNKHVKMRDTDKVYHSSLLFQIFMIIFTSLVITWLLYKPIDHFRSIDRMPRLKPITTGFLKKFKADPAHVNVGLYIDNFSTFDVSANKFVFSGIIWFLYDPTVISLNTLSNFSFQQGEIIYKSEPISQRIKSNILTRFSIKVSISSNINHKYFPLDDHNLFITLEDKTLSPSELIYNSSVDDFQISPEIKVSGNWRQVGTHVYTGYTDANIEKSDGDLNSTLTAEAKNVYIPRTVFAIDYARNGIRQLLTIFLPLVFIFYVSVYSLSLDPKKYSGAVLSLSAGSLTGALAYRFVIENLSPPDVGYFMLSDWIFFTFLALIFTIFLINIRIVSMSERVKKIVTIIFHSIVIAGAIYILSLSL